MKLATTFTALAGAASLVLAQGVTNAIAPQGAAPAGCSPSMSGKFEITAVKVAKRGLAQKRADCGNGANLVSTLDNGIIKDAQGRTGYIASNFQFQYDSPPQAGAIYTAGFSSCSNGSLALGPSAVFYQCQSGNFYNLYDRNWAPQCSPIEILILPCDGSSSSGGSGGPAGGVAEGGDGQIIGTAALATITLGLKPSPVDSPICHVTQISDGQVQVGTTPCASITTKPSPSPPLVPVTEGSDGQIKVTPPAAVPTVPAVTTTSAAHTPTPTPARTSAPATAGAETVKMSSAAAFLVGLVGAVALF